MLMIRNREVAYPASRFVHVLLDFSLWGNTKEHRVHKVKVNLTTSNKSIKRSSCVKVDALPYLLCQVRVKETVFELSVTRWSRAEKINTFMKCLNLSPSLSSKSCLAPLN